MNKRSRHPLNSRRVYSLPPSGYTERESCSSSLVYLIVFYVAPLFLIAALSLSSPFAVGRAYAAVWPVPTSELSASVSFHETYTAGDRSYVHSGIDIPASAGMQISSPRAGTVRYTGAVPSGDSRIGGESSQKTMNAVSIELEDGRIVTLMPFSSTCVSKGDYVDEGSPLGILAPEGDVSSAQTHLHMGLKKGRAYYDPMSLFGAAATGETPSEADAQEAAPAASAPDSSAALDSPELLLEERAHELLAQNDAARVPDPAQVPERILGTIETGELSWYAPAEEQASFAGAIGRFLEPVCSACCAQLADMTAALEGAAGAFGVPLPVFIAVFGMLAITSFSILLLIALRFASRGIGEMWRKGKTSLSVSGGGDSMHKLFPASGLAFITRSRISPREVTK